MANKLSQQATLIILGLSLLCSSCGRASALHPVTGKVFYEEKPASGAIVAFHRVGTEDKSIMPHAIVASDGTYKLTTFITEDGAPTGDYKVTVIWRQKPKNASKAGDDDDGILLTPRYCLPETSGLTAHINEGANQLEPFRLKK